MRWLPDHLIFKTGIPMLLRQNHDTETAPSWSAIETSIAAQLLSNCPRSHRPLTVVQLWVPDGLESCCLQCLRLPVLLPPPFGFLQPELCPSLCGRTHMPQISACPTTHQGELLELWSLPGFRSARLGRCRKDGPGSRSCHGLLGPCRGWACSKIPLKIKRMNKLVFHNI